MDNPKDELKEFSETCKNLTVTNLKYVLAVANALKFTERETIVQNKVGTA